MISLRKIYKKVLTLIDKLNYFDNLFQISKNSSSLSFYILLSLVSILVIIFQIITTIGSLDEFIIAKLLHIFSENFSSQIQSIIPSFNLNGFSIIILINILYSSSKTINGYNRIADFIYYEIKPRIGWKSRLSAFLMFSMLMFLFLFETAIIIFSNYLVKNVLQLNLFIVKLVQLILEFIVIYTTINILFIYAPPKKMSFKNTYIGALISSTLIYLLVSLFVLILNALNNFSIGYSLITIISYSLFILFAINYILIVGLIINYYGNLKQLKTSIFSKY